ncbi:hypothetical protein B9Z55_011266 [Caenorhabditis nigoni]|uniref:F-box domain-containing protein n=2 Tax=Caenorhabditis nigoni TaxID=1611254 RepID=A0A2G5UJB4_9PELO|nr:hypothetical protein B9Z55_011266 [Caenorhabditis nigoni]
MSNSKFPFRRLPDDLCSKVLKTMGHHEIIAYSFTSKKSLSFVQSLGLPLKKVRIKMEERPRIYLHFRPISVLFKLRMDGIVGGMTSLYQIPSDVDVTVQTIDNSRMFRRVTNSTTFTWSNQEKSIGEWIRYLCSIFRCASYEARFDLFNTRFDLQSLRNTFPKLRRIAIDCFDVEPSEEDIQSFQNISRALLPHAENVELFLEGNISIQHIGMANLKQLEIEYPRNPNFDDLLTWNVERFITDTEHFSFRDLNRFFKLWTKGSNPRLKYLAIDGEALEDWNVLLKGLKAEKVGRRKKYTIQNCVGIRARIKINNDIDTFVTVKFIVLK